MAKFHNNSDRYLWEKGMAPVLAWLVVLLGGYFIFILYHGPVTGINNDYLTILWAIATAWLMIYWLRMGERLLESVHSWFFGYIGEWIVRRRLLKLPDEYHVFYDYKIPGRRDNIDFVVVCKYGVFAVEVKSFFKTEKDLSGWWAKKGEYQAKKQSERLNKYLESKGFQIDKTYAVLVFAFQKDFVPIKNKGLLVFGNMTLRNFFDVSLPKNIEVFSDLQISNITKVLKNK